MLDDLLRDENDASLDDYHTVRSFWPLVQAHDGQAESREWFFARALFLVARRTLEGYRAEGPTSEQQVATALKDVQQHELLARRDGFMYPYEPVDWFKVQACFSRVLPLVERLLLR